MNAPTSGLAPENIVERIQNIHDGVLENDKATRERLATIAPTHDRIPLSPEQVDAFRPHPWAKTVDEAKAIAYKCGLKDLEPFVRRMLALEAKVVEQATQITALQGAVLKLKYPKQASVA